MLVHGFRGKLAVGRLGLAFAVSIAATCVAFAERLPIKTYTSADGLGHNVVNRVGRDSRGFLWFCTREGLSRFDGYSFTNYGIDQGLASAIVNDLLETPDGQYWVATAAGLCRFNPKGRPLSVVRGASPTPQDNIQRTSNGEPTGDPMFTIYFPGDDARSKHISTLLLDRAGHVWCGTSNGLYRCEAYGNEVKFVHVELGISDYLQSRSIECLLEDRAGSLWVGTGGGLFRMRPDKRVEAYRARNGLPGVGIHSLLEDREGRLWVGTRVGGLCLLVPDPAPARSVVARVYTEKDGLATTWINQLFQASDGSLWAGSNAGLIQFVISADGRDFRFRAYAEPHGIHGEVASMAEDRDGNLWLAGLHGGAAKIARTGFMTYDKTDGFSWASAIFQTRAGDLFVVGAPTGEKSFINRFDGEKFTPIAPQSLKHEKGFTWGWNQIVLEDHTGEWWMATRLGVCRFPKPSQPEQLAHTSPKAVYTTRDGLAANVILRLFEDSRGDIWISSVGEGKSPNGLSRWERSTSTFHHYTEKDGLPRFDIFYVSSFAEDRAGALWIGFSGDGGLARYRDGRFSLFTTSDGVPAGQIRNLYVDSAGRLWVPTYRGGLSRIDDPAGERPQLVSYTTADGLSSNEVTSVTEDRWGRIYIGTGRGIDRLDPATGLIKHYTTADGLPLGEIMASVRDRQGGLWFSFGTGLVRLVPEPDPPSVSPPILITGLRIAGDTQPISALGETEVASMELDARRNQLQIEFVGLGFSPGEGLRYQYRLEGAGEDWSQPSEQRVVNFANLAPGRYRFLARAVNADGVASERAASFAFTILPPIWQRWWFIAIVSMLIGLIAYVVYRYRVARLLELERVRTRIAADLHDDIGANLTKIGILSEVVRQQANELDRLMAEPLSSIARISRESVASMSDIVWAINPKRDTLRDLTRRMREFAGEIFASRDLEFELRSPASETYLNLGADVRRTVFLIFKEAVNNIVRHSDCDRADIELRVEGSLLVLTVSDDGRGFDSSPETAGNGLVSMRNRAASMGGEVEIVTRNPSGTRVTLRLPIKQSKSSLTKPTA